jgi:hypothetical protein
MLGEFFGKTNNGEAGIIPNIGKQPGAQAEGP